MKNRLQLNYNKAQKVIKTSPVTRYMPRTNYYYLCTLDRRTLENFTDWLNYVRVKVHGGNFCKSNDHSSRSNHFREQKVFNVIVCLYVDGRCNRTVLFENFSSLIRFKEKMFIVPKYLPKWTWTAFVVSLHFRV